MRQKVMTQLDICVPDMDKNDHQAALVIDFDMKPSRSTKTFAHTRKSKQPILGVRHDSRARWRKDLSDAMPC